MYKIGSYTIDRTQTLDKGGYGHIYPAKDKKNKTIIAKKVDLKKYSKPAVGDRHEKLYQEICSNQIRHENIITVLKCLREEGDKEHLWVFMELCEFGNLQRIYKCHPE